MTFSVNHPILFLLAGIVIAVVLAQSVFFLIRAWRRGVQMGMDQKRRQPAPEDGQLDENLDGCLRICCAGAGRRMAVPKQNR